MDNILLKLQDYHFKVTDYAAGNSKQVIDGAIAYLEKQGCGSDEDTVRNALAIIFSQLKYTVPQWDDCTPAALSHGCQFSCRIEGEVISGVLCVMPRAVQVTMIHPVVRMSRFVELSSDLPEIFTDTPESDHASQCGERIAKELLVDLYLDSINNVTFDK